MVDEINKQIKKMKKIARKGRQHLDDKNDNKLPYQPCRRKRQINVQHPAVILMILQVVKKLLKAQAWEKEGAKSLNLCLARKRKQKKEMEKENDLVVSFEGSDSRLSEAEDK